jgi:hypothetical protein
MHFQGVGHRIALATFVFVATIFTYSHQAFAAAASGLSIGVGEEYNDNIFFTNQGKDKNETDFITHIVPTFTFMYAPLGAIAPTLNGSLSVGGEIFARHSDQSNFGKNIIGNIGYTYRPTPRLGFHIADNVNRQGSTRTIGLEAFAPPPVLPITPTQVAPAGAFVALPAYQDVGGLVTSGTNLTNYLLLDATYLWAPTFTLSGSYANSYTNSAGDAEVTNTVGFRGNYNFRRDHNLHAGYSITIVSSNTSSGNKSGNSEKRTHIIHNIDIGDDYFSAFKVQIDPTWTISASGGIGINTSGGGPGVGANGNITMIKVWERAIANLALRRGFTGSFGLSSGPSLTTTVSGGFGFRVTEDLTALLGAEYSLFNTKDVDFKIFRAAAGAQYWVTRWLSSNLWYAYRFRDAGSGAGDTNIGASGRATGNAVVLTASIHFDTYPNLRLSRGPLPSLYQQMGAPQYLSPDLQKRYSTEPAPPPPLQ